jgi:hypothetical protein
MSTQELCYKVWACIGLSILTYTAVRTLCEIIQSIYELIKSIPDKETRELRKADRIRVKANARQLEALLKYCEEERKRNEEMNR